MADGALSTTRRKASYSAFDDTDPRFAETSERTGGENTVLDAFASRKKKARIAFTGEEFGFGYKAADEFIRRADNKRGVADGGRWAISGPGGSRTERELDEASPNDWFDYKAPLTQPLRTKEQALMAVKQHTADFAVVPFYNPFFGYDFEALRALSSLFTLLAVEQIEASDVYCLAVHESQLYDLIQSAHPGTGFSALQRRFRKSWGAVDNGSGNAPGARFDAEMPRAGLPIDMGDQKLIRDRIDLVFAGPEAARRCKSKLDGMRALGIEVQEISQQIEPHRELAKLARTTANSSRQTNTFFDPISGDTRFFSTLGAEAQDGKLFGMVLPYEVAMRSSDYVIIDHNMDDAEPSKSRFLVVEENPDHTLYEDAYRTTDARTRYWMRRLVAVSGGALPSGYRHFVGALILLAGFIAAAVGTDVLFGSSILNRTQFAPVAELVVSPALTIAAGLAVAFIGWLASNMQGQGGRGVRVMLRFRRDAHAASLGDIENYLRNYGVRHAVTRLDEDSETDRPASVLLDIEFEPQHFVYGLFSMFSSRLRGSVVNGAMKKSFQRWKDRGTLVLAAIPVGAAAEYQLPKHARRRWWFEAVASWVLDFAETMFIRLARLLLYILPLAFAAYVVWRMLGGGK